MRSEQPITGLDSEPEPDISVVRGTEGAFFTEHPHTAELVIEVSLTSPDRDGRPSLPLTRSSLRDLRVESPCTQHSSAGLFSVVPAGRPKPGCVAASNRAAPHPKDALK